MDEKSTVYITPEGHQRLAREAEYLWKVERPKVTREVGEAAAQGDRSENAEYIYGKKRLREIDRRLGWLSKRLDQLTVVTEVPRQQDRVFFGAWVSLEDEDGNEATYRIVGPDESDADRGYISMNSPMARALLRKEEGDEVKVKRPKGETLFTIVEVRYTPPGDDSR
ncbi:MAG: transcription elongation factor GreB [Pseudomonadota bacterium]